MSPLIFLLIIAALYLASKPKFRLFVERDGMYLSREWTSFVNAFFISLVVCSHSLIHFETSIRDYYYEKITASGIALFGQLMVTTFFFYSGYGIMLSLLNRKEYTKTLIHTRFSNLSINFVLAVGIYFIAHCILRREIILSDFLGGLYDCSILGNPTWFILMTLLIYVLTYVCFSFHNKKNTNIIIIFFTILLTIIVFFVSKFKPLHWVNTLLCFPAGMFYYLKGESIEKLIKKTRIPSIIYALIASVNFFL